MTFDLAVEGAAKRVPGEWRVEPFRRHASLVTDVNQLKKNVLLSLSSKGSVSPRTDEGGLGRQAPADKTIERYWVVRPGNLVVNPMWLIGGGIGVSTTAGAVSPDYRVYSLGSDIHPRYAHYLLRSQPYIDQYRLYTRADTTFDRRVSKVNFHAMPIIVPPLEEQRRIADFLDAETARVDQLRSFHAEQVDLLALRRERLIEDYLGLTTSTSYSNGALTPLKYLVDKVSVGIVITPAAWYVEGGGVPALRGVNVGPGHIKCDDLVQISSEGDCVNKKSRLMAGDIVVVRTGQAGVAAVVPPDLEGANCIDLIIVRPGKRIESKYLEYVLNSGWARHKIEEYSVGSIQAHFNVSAMKNLAIPKVPLEEQRQKVAFLEREVRHMDQLLQLLKQQDMLLEERRRAVVTAAVTGKLDVTTARRVS